MKAIRKVLLITPPAITFKSLRDINPVPPLGLAYIAAVLERRGLEVEIFDSLIEDTERVEDVGPGIIRIGASFSAIKDKIEKFAPDMVGVSNLFSRQAVNAHEIYRIVKSVNPGIVVVAGGAHPTVMAETVMKDENVDFVVMGEGEDAIAGLVDHIEGRKESTLLDGIVFRKNGETRVVPKKSFIEDLDSIPFPARHLLKMERYFGLKQSHGERQSMRFSPIVTSRGCPMGCTFCTAHHVWGRLFRARSPENVIKEMEELKSKYGVEELLIEDDNLTLDTKRAEKIFDLMIERKLGLKWDTPNGVAAFTLTNDLVKKMKDAGCYKMNIAVESGNKDILKNVIKKPLDLEKVRSLVDYARSIGLRVGIFLIIGMPGETLKNMWESYRFADKIGAHDAFVSIATPYPGSELYKLCMDKGYIKEGFSLNNLYITSASISTDAWSGEDVRNLFKKGYYYLQFHKLKKRPLLLMKLALKNLFSDPAGFFNKARSLCQNMKN